MKKLVKLLIATALIVTMAVCFAACGGKTMEKVYDLSGVKATAVATKTGQLNDFTDQQKATAAGEWVVVYKTNYNDKKEAVSNTYTLYNAATEKIVATSTTKNGNPFYIESYFGEYVAAQRSSYIEHVGYTKISNVYYGETSVNVGKVDPSSIITNGSAKLVKVGDYIFKVVDGEISYVENATASISNLDGYMNGYYYEFEDDGITVYDASLNLYGYVRVPSYASAYPIVLANGNVLIQYFVDQDPYGDDYDMIEVRGSNVSKQDVTTLLYNVEKNTAKEIKFDYLVAEVETENLSEKIDNIAYMYEIKDSRIDDSQESAIVAKLSNNGKVGTIYGKAEDYLVNAYMAPVAENRFMGYSISGEKVLYNEEMEKLATFSRDSYFNEQYIVEQVYDNEEYEYVPTKVYNFDGLLIVDLTQYDGAYEFSNGNMLFVENDVDNSQVSYYLLANGSYSKIATYYTGSAEKTSGEELEAFGEDYYVITKWTKNAETGLVKFVDYVYNMNGQELTHTVEYVSRYATNSENKATAIYDREVVTEAEGLLVFRVTVKKYNENKDENDQVIGYETFTEYYYCK